ncbi:putative Glycoside hydrolase family 11 protein [Seiridium cardinale]|uniref:endo-1,4-beta-xylanase n=1 Tax=Seiridium cardinale TaxID=138064 RepID=A0ABR2XMI4_9PEZI
MFLCPTINASASPTESLVSYAQPADKSTISSMHTASYLPASHGQSRETSPSKKETTSCTPAREPTSAVSSTATFQQFWSVRTKQRVGGTITTGKHFDSWNAAGMKLGGHDYMILATEWYTATGGSGSSGTASITLD